MSQTFRYILVLLQETLNESPFARVRLPDLRNRGDELMTKVQNEQKSTRRD
jgi:hypothetical protein